MRKVFLSSAATDLAPYRDAAYRAVEGLDGFHCVRMEDFGARDARADDFCRQQIAKCDVAVFLVGLCFGSAPPGSMTSYTQREYEAAGAADRPRLVFLSPDDFYPGYYREPDDARLAQQTFRSRVNAEAIRAAFKTPEDLAAKVTQALANWAAGNREAQAHQAPRAVVGGSGAIAQGLGAVAAGAGGVAIGGGVHGSVIVTGNMVGRRSGGDRER